MRAEIVSVGTELLLGQIVDTNAAHLSRVLSDLGISVYRRTTVGDNRDRLLAALRQALDESDVVITIGGLGPTQDDITRETLAEAMHDTLLPDEEIAHRLKAFFRLRKIQMPESVLRQAQRPAHGRLLDNPNGTAPGLLFEQGDQAVGRSGGQDSSPKSKIQNPKSKIAMALPGPPNEFLPMVEHHVIPYLRALTGAATIRSRVLRICALGESMVEERVLDLIGSENPTVAPYAKTGEVHLRVTARAATAEEAERMVAERVELVRQRLGRHIYGEDDETLEQVVVKLMIAKHLTVATAESCTGGLLASRITNVPGSSAVFPGGVVSYANEAKTELVYVAPELIEQYGAVSPQVAEALAIGARRRFGTDFGIGITGIAGPDGGTSQKPVGLVYIAIASDSGTKVDECRYLGSRQDVRFRSTQQALVLLRKHVMRNDAVPCD